MSKPMTPLQTLRAAKQFIQESGGTVTTKTPPHSQAPEVVGTGPTSITMNLKFHDEKLYGFWGGIYAVLEPDSDDTQCVAVAAICDQPEAKKMALYFVASPKLYATGKLALEALEYVLERGGDMGAPGVKLAADELRKAIALAEGDNG
jgi:hypothetical protein